MYSIVYMSFCCEILATRHGDDFTWLISTFGKYSLLISQEENLIQCITILMYLDVHKKKLLKRFLRKIK